MRSQYSTCKRAVCLGFLATLLTTTQLFAPPGEGAEEQSGGVVKNSMQAGVDEEESKRDLPASVPQQQIEEERFSPSLATGWAAWAKNLSMTVTGVTIGLAKATAQRLEPVASAVSDAVSGAVSGVAQRMPEMPQPVRSSLREGGHRLADVTAKGVKMTVKGAKKLKEKITGSPERAVIEKQPALDRQENG